MNAAEERWVQLHCPTPAGIDKKESKSVVHGDSDAERVGIAAAVADQMAAFGSTLRFLSPTTTPAD